ncbi:MAG TPA: DinB family protein [Gemmatimonadaceae bacterium]|nr:DinB family protein [Gemmatimonadaceae bacterium]
MHDPEALLVTLERGPMLIIPLIRDVPPERLKQRPAPGKWSAYEHACHIALSHGLFTDRLARMLAEDDPQLKPYDPGDEAPDVLMKMDLDAALLGYARERGEIVERLRALTPAQWERTGRHPEYAHYTVFIMFRHLALHDMLHAYRIEEILTKRDW